MLVKFKKPRTIALPFYNNLTKKQIGYVVDNLRDVLKKVN